MIKLIQTHSKKFHCIYLLHYYPFDTQVKVLFFVCLVFGPNLSRDLNLHHSGPSLISLRSLIALSLSSLTLVCREDRA